jgi:hypothetical protein
MKRRLARLALGKDNRRQHVEAGADQRRRWHDLIGQQDSREALAHINGESHCLRLVTVYRLFILRRLLSYVIVVTNGESGDCRLPRFGFHNGSAIGKSAQDRSLSSIMADL